MSIVQPLPDARSANSRIPCANCGLCAGCLPAGLNAREQTRLKGLMTPRHGIRRGAYLFRAGSESQLLYAIRSGSLKGCVMDKEGREQVVGFYLAGELLGMEAIGSGRHVCDVVALEDSEVCKIPFAELQRLIREIPALGHHLHCMMSAEIGRGYGVMLLLGSLRADERLASFLLNLSHRLLARNYSPSQLHLRMTRHEIASYLGLKLETVSRMLSRFQREAILAVQGKEIRLVKPEKLKSIMQGADLRLGGALANADPAVMMTGFPAGALPGRVPTVGGVRAAPAG